MRIGNVPGARSRVWRVAASSCGLADVDDLEARPPAPSRDVEAQLRCRPGRHGGRCAQLDALAHGRGNRAARRVRTRVTDSVSRSMISNSSRELSRQIQQQLQCLERLQAAEHAGHGTEDSGLGAVADEAVAGRFRPHAAQTGAAALRPHDLKLPLVLIHAGENDRLAQSHARVIQDELGREVVRAVDDRASRRDDCGRRGRVEPHRVSMYLDLGVQRAQARGGELDLGLAHVRQAVERLPVEVRCLQPIARRPDRCGRRRRPRDRS